MTDTETDLRRPSSAAYHAGPWKTDMRMRQVHEVIIRSEMRRTLLAWWGCAR